MLKKIPYVQGLTWLTVLFVLPLPLIQALALGLPAIYASEALAIQLGSIAYVWFLVAIYLSTRPKWLDRLIGLPSVYFIHGVLSIFAIILAFLHKIQTHSFGWIRLTGNWALYLFIGLAVYSLVFLAGWLTSHFHFLKWLKGRLEQLFHHEFSVWLHRLNLVAVLLVFIHVQLISYITSISSYIWLFNGYTILALGLYLVQKIRHVWGLPTAKLTAKRALAPNFFEFTIQLKHPQKLSIAPGDYLFMNCPNHDELRELHPFSVVNAVTDQGVVVLAIRGDGDFTRRIQTLRVGAKIRLEGSYGRFYPVIRAHDKDALVLVAGGSGVVPMLAIIAAFPGKKITLYYTAHIQADMIYIAELQQQAQQRQNLEIHLQAHRFDLTKVVPQILDAQTTYLLSGPPALGHAWQKALQAQGIQHGKCYYEEFSW